MYCEKGKTSLKEILKDLDKRDTIFLDWKAQYYLYVCAFQTDL